MNQMKADNERKAADLQDATILRMSKAQPLEKSVCQLMLTLANKIVGRVYALHMQNLPLPLNYVVKFATVGKVSGWFLYKTVDDAELIVNEEDPIVQLSLVFYRDVKEGLGRRIEETYTARQKEFAAAYDLLTVAMQQGLSSVATNGDSSQQSDTMNRWNILGEESAK